MKRTIQIVILLFILFLIYQFISSWLIKEHKIEYTITNGDKKFDIKETYKEGIYYFDVREGNRIFSFHNNSSFNNAKEILDTIEYEQTDDYFCIYPVIQSRKGAKQNEVLCDVNGEITTYTYLKQRNFIPVDSFIQHLQQRGYNNPSWNKVANTAGAEEFKNMTLYADNLLDKATMIVWDYKGIVVFDNESKTSFDLLNNDRYENNHGYLVGKYYLFPDEKSPYDFASWHMIDVKSWSKYNISMDHDISFDSYINGVLNNELYVFDRSNKRQIAVSVKNKKVREVGNEQSGAIYYDGKKSTRNIYDFINQDLIFNTFDGNHQNEPVNTIKTISSDDITYFLTREGKIYEQSIYEPYKNIVLCQLPDVSELLVIDNVLYILSSSSVYQYDAYSGLNLILEYNELKYNHNNMLAVYMK